MATTTRHETDVTKTAGSGVWRRWKDLWRRTSRGPEIDPPKDASIHELLSRVGKQLIESENPQTFDFYKAFVELGCADATADLLADYLPAACGRAVARELGIILSDTYSRPDADGTVREHRFDDDPLWLSVERYVESIRLDHQGRRQFSRAAVHSSEVATINEAVKAGQKLEELRGGRSYTSFISPRRDTGAG